MNNTASENDVNVAYGPYSLKYEPEKPLALISNPVTFKAIIHKIPDDFAIAIVNADELPIVRPKLAGRKRLRLYDGGNHIWHKTVAGIAREINAYIEPLPPELMLTRGDTVPLRAVDWLWDGWLAKGKLHILAGEPGTGKTTIALALAAVITAGTEWPDGALAMAGEVIIWSGEDDVQDTLAPRLKAMGANMQRIHFISGVTDSEGKRAFDPAYDAIPLATSVENYSPALLIVDPIVSAIDGDGHKNSQTRRALQPLVDLSRETGTAILGITHFSKGTSGKNPVERVTGSLAFSAMARIVMVTAKMSQHKGGCVLCRAKSNIGIDQGGFLYKLEEKLITPNLAAYRVAWGDAVQQTAHELLADAEANLEEPNAIDAAADFLKSELAHDPVSANELMNNAKEAGISWRTVERAKKHLKIISKKQSSAEGSKWLWELPTTVSANQDRQVEGVADLADMVGLTTGNSSENLAKDQHRQNSIPSSSDEVGGLTLEQKQKPWQEEF